MVTLYIGCTTNFFFSLELLLQYITQNDRNDQLNSSVGTKKSLGTLVRHICRKTLSLDIFQQFLHNMVTSVWLWMNKTNFKWTFRQFWLECNFIGLAQTRQGVIVIRNFIFETSFQIQSFYKRWHSAFRFDSIFGVFWTKTSFS